MTDMLQCPQCKMSVLPKRDGSCPSCQYARLATPVDAAPTVTLDGGAFAEKPLPEIPRVTLPAKTLQRCQRLFELGVCKHCGIEAQTRLVQFNALVGKVVWATFERHEARCCRPCAWGLFKKASGRTLIWSWLFPPSLLFMPLTLFINGAQYTLCLMTPMPSQKAVTPRLTANAIARISERAMMLFERLGTEDDTKRVIHQMAEVSQVTEGQLLLYIQQAALPA